ncbi:DUF2247 family protein [Pseudomonas sp. D1-2]
MLLKLGLACWSTIHLGIKKGWVKRNEVFKYAIDKLADGKDSLNVALIAGRDYLTDEELLSLIEGQMQGRNVAFDMEKWRLAFLICVEESTESDDDKVRRLQEIYADFDYPEDMSLCSIYSLGDTPPLAEMSQVVQKLKERFCFKGKGNGFI